MEQLALALEALLTNAISTEHWPFFAVMTVLAVVGQIMSKRVFTRENARFNFGSGTLGKLLHEWFYWGRETLPLHAILCSGLLSFAWRDPEGRGWNAAATTTYWLLCGVSSLFTWAAIKGWAKRKGIALEMLGDSGRPPSLPPEALTTLPPDALIDDNDASK